MVAVLNVNLVAVLVAAVVQMALGFLWYSPMLFGNSWMKLVGIKPSDMEKGKKEMPKSAGLGFLAAVVMTFILAQVIGFMQAATLVDGLLAGFWMWLGFVATVLAGFVLWEGKPVKLYLINSGYYLVALLLSSAILVLWK
ncbi:DUF1761 domain-containing protein [Candidatus Micrarchaeota archaeon]|nr:DUF1761 domain-containing protein [Candidatus Micrarchaeota archaeon]